MGQCASTAKGSPQSSLISQSSDTPAPSKSITAPTVLEEKNPWLKPAGADSSPCISPKSVQCVIEHADAESPPGKPPCYLATSPSSVRPTTYGDDGHLRFLNAGADALPLSVTMCSSEGLQVLYQNCGSVAYAGDWRGLQGQDSTASLSHSYLMQLLSLQPPETVEEVMEAIRKDDGPWVRVIQVLPSMAAPPTPQVTAPADSPSPKASLDTTELALSTMKSFKSEYSMTESLNFGASGGMESPCATNPNSLSGFETITDTAQSGSRLASQVTKARRGPRKENSSSWLAQQFDSKAHSAQRRPAPKSMSSSDMSKRRSIELGIKSQASVPVSGGIPAQRTASRPSLSAMGPMSTTRGRLAKLLKSPTADESGLEEANESPEQAAAGTAKEGQGGTDACPPGTCSTKEVDKVWHEITITPFTHPDTGEKAFVVAQSDVTQRCKLEQRLMQMTEAQLYMLESMFPRHILERITEIATAETEGSKAGTRGASILDSMGSISAEPPKLAAIHRELTQATTFHDCVTIMFTDICGFTTMSESVEPQQVMSFLNGLFSQFDGLVRKHKVSKVETAGDCFIICAGLLEEDDDGFMSLADKQAVSHARAAKRALNFAAEMLHISSTFTMPDGNPVRQRVGIHTGPVVSGLIGNLLPKFSLFGDTMNTASRMESTSIPGRIQVSEATHALLMGDAPECWECTGGVEIKGKGKMVTYLLTQEAMSTPFTIDTAAGCPGINPSFAPLLSSTPSLGYCRAFSIDLRKKITAPPTSSRRRSIQQSRYGPGSSRVSAEYDPSSRPATLIEEDEPPESPLVGHPTADDEEAETPESSAASTVQRQNSNWAAGILALASQAGSPSTDLLEAMGSTSARTVQRQNSAWAASMMERLTEVTTVPDDLQEAMSSLRNKNAALNPLFESIADAQLHFGLLASSMMSTGEVVSSEGGSRVLFNEPSRVGDSQHSGPVGQSFPCIRMTSGGLQFSRGNGSNLFPHSQNREG